MLISLLMCAALAACATSLSRPSLTVALSVTPTDTGYPQYCTADPRFHDFHQCSRFHPAQDWCQSKCPQPHRGRGNDWPDCHDDPLCEILDILRLLERQEEREYMSSACSCIAASSTSSIQTSLRTTSRPYSMTTTRNTGSGSSSRTSPGSRSSSYVSSKSSSRTLFRSTISSTVTFSSASPTLSSHRSLTTLISSTTSTSSRSSSHSASTSSSSARGSSSLHGTSSSISSSSHRVSTSLTSPSSSSHSTSHTSSRSSLSTTPSSSLSHISSSSTHSALHNTLTLSSSASAQSSPVRSSTSHSTLQTSSHTVSSSHAASSSHANTQTSLVSSGSLSHTSATSSTSRTLSTSLSTTPRTSSTSSSSIPVSQSSNSPASLSSSRLSSTANSSPSPSLTSGSSISTSGASLINSTTISASSSSPLFSSTSSLFFSGTTTATGLSSSTGSLVTSTSSSAVISITSSSTTSACADSPTTDTSRFYLVASPTDSQGVVLDGTIGSLQNLNGDQDFLAFVSGSGDTPSTFSIDPITGELVSNDGTIGAGEIAGVVAGANPQMVQFTIPSDPVNDTPLDCAILDGGLSCNGISVFYACSGYGGALFTLPDTSGRASCEPITLQVQYLASTTSCSSSVVLSVATPSITVSSVTISVATPSISLISVTTSSVAAATTTCVAISPAPSDSSCGAGAGIPRAGSPAGAIVTDLDSCATLCASNPTCVSVGYLSGACIVYDTSATQDGGGSPFPPYQYYDISCFDCSTSPLSSSTTQLSTVSLSSTLTTLTSSVLQSSISSSTPSPSCPSPLSPAEGGPFRIKVNSSSYGYADLGGAYGEVEESNDSPPGKYVSFGVTNEGPANGVAVASTFTRNATNHQLSTFDGTASILDPGPYIAYAVSDFNSEAGVLPQNEILFYSPADAPTYDSSNNRFTPLTCNIDDTTGELSCGTPFPLAFNICSEECSGCEDAISLNFETYQGTSSGLCFAATLEVEAVLPVCSM